MSYKQPVFSVSNVNEWISNIFVAEEMLHDILIVGEISNLSVKNDNAYLILKDSNSQLDCVCFGVSKTYQPKNGERVVVFGSIKYYARGGRLSFNVKRFEPDGLGEQFIKLEALKQQLSTEGLFAQTRKKPVPSFVRKLCVLTSIKGAVVQDIFSTIFKYTTMMNITVVDVRVQGEQAVPSILSALSRVDAMDFDVIIVARGGGSFEDLMPFNDEQLVRAVATLKTPLISAVGHETDYTLLDMVADERALTPTAAAERVAHAASELQTSLSDAVNRLNYLYLHTVESCEREVDMLAQSLELRYFGRLDKVAAEVDGLSAIISAHNPNNVLRAGYAVAENSKGRVRSVNDIKAGETLTLHFADGQAQVSVEKIGG